MLNRQLRQISPFVLLIVLAFLADQVSKRWVAAYLAQQEALTDFGPFSLRMTHNTGLSFGLFQGSGPLVGWLTIGIVAVLSVWLARASHSQWLLKMGLALLIGGALGNMIDRITAGRVLDFIVAPLWPSVFNVADVAIRTGAALAIIGAITKPGTRASHRSDVRPWRR